MNTHTQGPWRVADQNGMIVILAPQGHSHKSIACCGHDERRINAWRVDEGHYPDNAANAKLIAAAPTLLDALEAVISGPSKLNSRLRFIVKQAIAAATR
jgi:hypothetical protein